jgi:predicted acyltransferase
MCYVLASVLALCLKSSEKIACAIGVLSILHVGLLLLFGGPEGALTLEGNFARKIDLAVFGENHIYHGYGIPFDPEGLLGVLTGTCTVLIGYMIGCSVRNGSSEQSQTDVSARIFVISAGLLLVGLALSIIIPLNKPLWSVSYVFYTAGWASFVLALLIYLIDYKGWEKPFFPFKALGMNALALFVLSGLLMKINWRYIDWDYTAVFGSTKFLSLVFALLYMLLHLVIAVIMYRKKIFIKL